MTRIELFHVIARKVAQNPVQLQSKMHVQTANTFLKSVPKSVDFRLVKCCKTQSNYGPKCTGKRSHIHTNPVLNPCHKLTRINVDVRAYTAQFSYRACEYKEHLIIYYIKTAKQVHKREHKYFLTITHK